MSHLFYDVYKRTFEWLFRVRTLGAQLIKSSVALLLALLAADFAGRVSFSFGDLNLDVQGSAGSGLPSVVFYAVLTTAFLMLVVGGGLVWRDERRERRKVLIVIEVRGLHASPDTPAKDAVLPSFRGERKYIQVDFRPGHASELVNPERILDSITGMRLHVRSAAQGRDMGDVTVAAGGVAAIPAMFLIGMLMEDESRIQRYDWDRDLACWELTGRLDDGNRILPLEMPHLSATDTDVVLAVSASYAVNNDAIVATFPSLPIVRLTAKKLAVNSYWSEEVQQEFAVGFRDAIQGLLACNVKRIHLILAAPASLALRLGGTYDERLHPEVVVYQYEKSAAPPYPWGILLPNHGFAEPKIVRSVQEIT